MLGWARHQMILVMWMKRCLQFFSILLCARVFVVDILYLQFMQIGCFLCVHIPAQEMAGKSRGGCPLACLVQPSSMRRLGRYLLWALTLNPTWEGKLHANATCSLGPAYLVPLTRFLFHYCQREHGQTSQLLHLLPVLLFGTQFPVPSLFHLPTLSLFPWLTHSHPSDLTSSERDILEL